MGLIALGMYASGKIIHRMGAAWCALTFSIFLALCATRGSAGVIAYPDQGPVPPGVTFTNIFESSGTDPVPLYGPPTAFTTGLDFDPASFTAAGNGGGSDITDGQLNFSLQGSLGPSQLVGISSISLFEAGDFTLVGTGTLATQNLAGAIIRLTVTQIDGVNITPFDLSPSNASVGFNLVANPGIVQPWSLGLSLNIGAQLTALGYSYQAGATGLEVVIGNTLLALSEAGGIAAVAKRDFRIDVDTNVIPVPEPASCTLLAVGGLMASVAWFRRRGGRPR